MCVCTFLTKKCVAVAMAVNSFGINYLACFIHAGWSAHISHGYNENVTFAMKYVYNVSVSSQEQCNVM